MRRHTLYFPLAVTILLTGFGCSSPVAEQHENKPWHTHEYIENDPARPYKPLGCDARDLVNFSCDD